MQLFCRFQPLGTVEGSKDGSADPKKVGVWSPTRPDACQARCSLWPSDEHCPVVASQGEILTPLGQATSASANGAPHTQRPTTRITTKPVRDSNETVETLLCSRNPVLRVSGKALLNGDASLQLWICRIEIHPFMQSTFPLKSRLRPLGCKSTGSMRPEQRIDGFAYGDYCEQPRLKLENPIW
jgi:hypothetical protein